MAPRKSGGAAAEQVKERLTAVVMADSFTQHFRPITAQHPKVLLPLVNAPMLDHTLEWLAMNGMEEVFVFCCAHAEQIQAHLDAAGWTASKRMRIHAVVSTNCLSLGDALRLMDHKDTVKTDFVLVSGDVVTNMKLGPALDAHQRRRAAEKSSIMTLVMRGGMKPAHRVRLGAMGLTTVVDLQTSRLLKLEEMPAGGGRQGLRLDATLFSERDDVAVRSDLVATGIYICAPEVLMLFSDNFDYQNVRRDFVSGVLSEEELGNKLFVHELEQEYAARVRTLRSYDAVSRDVLARWAYPQVPDANLFGTRRVAAHGSSSSSSRDTDAELGPKGKRTSYRYLQGRIYLDNGVSVARSARLGHGVCIGSGTTVAADAIVHQCVIGRGCRIGAGAVLRGCYLGDGVMVGEGAQAAHALLCDGVVLKPTAMVQPNSVLAFGVVIDKGAIVPGGARVSLLRPPPPSAVGADFDDELEVPCSSTAHSLNRKGVLSSDYASSFSEDDSDGEYSGDGGPELDVLQAAAALAADGIPETSIDFSTEVVGAMGAGFAWPPLEAAVAALYGLAVPLEELLQAESAEAAADDKGSDTEGDAAFVDVGASGSGTLGADAGQARAESATVAGGTGAASPEPHFKREVAETFLRCVKENISHENVVIELNGLKIAEDKTFADCARYMLTTALGLCLPAPAIAAREYRGMYNPEDLDCDSKDGKVELLRRAAAQLRRWRGLLQKFLKSEEDQVELLLTLEEFCGEEEDFGGTGERGAAFVGIFPQLLKVLYELDIAGEEAILAWAEEKTHADEEEKRFLRLAQPLLEWLQEAEEESASEAEEERSEGNEYRQ